MLGGGQGAIASSAVGRKAVRRRGERDGVCLRGEPRGGMAASFCVRAQLLLGARLCDGVVAERPVQPVASVRILLP